MARRWEEVKAEAMASGHLTEEGLAKARSQLEDHLRAYMLAEIRKRQHVTQIEIARRLGVGQPRISQLERGDLDRAELSTLRGYVEALGGQLEISATFGEERLRIA